MTTIVAYFVLLEFKKLKSFGRARRALYISDRRRRRTSWKFQQRIFLRWHSLHEQIFFFLSDIFHVASEIDSGDKYLLFIYPSDSQRCLIPSSCTMCIMLKSECFAAPIGQWTVLNNAFDVSRFSPVFFGIKRVGFCMILWKERRKEKYTQSASTNDFKYSSSFFMISWPRKKLKNSWKLNNARMSVHWSLGQILSRFLIFYPRNPHRKVDGSKISTRFLFSHCLCIFVAVFCCWSARNRSPRIFFILDMLKRFPFNLLSSLNKLDQITVHQIR